jgi:aminomethyltransferase
MQKTAKDFKVTLTNKSAETAQLALQGPKAIDIIKKLTDAPVDNLGYYHFLPEEKVAGLKCNYFSYRLHWRRWF